MPGGRIFLRHNFTGESSNFLIIVWSKTSSPLTNASGFISGSGLGSQDSTTATKAVYQAPYDQQSLVIEQIDPVIYDVKAYRSSDGVTLDEQINILACDAAAHAQYSTITYYYQVDRGEGSVTEGAAWSDPVSETIELRDERLKDQTYQVFERGTGEIIPPSETGGEYTDRSDAGGGFDLAVDGKVFQSQTWYTVTVHNRVDAIESGSGSGSGSSDEVNGVIPITEDADFDATAMNGKLLYAAGPSSDIITITFPNLSLVSDCTFKVSTHGGSQKYLALQLDAGDSAKLKSADYNVIYLGKGESCSVFIKNNVFYFLKSPEGYDNLGKVIWGHMVENNMISMDGTQYDQSDEPRLMQWIETFSGGQVISEGTGSTQWGYSTIVNGKIIYPNKGKFARDDIGETIRVPDMRNMGLRGLKYLDGTTDSERESQGPGGYQIDSVGSFTGIFPIPKGNSYTGAPNNDIFGNGSNNPEIRNLSMDVDTDKDETRMENIGLIPLLCV